MATENVFQGLSYSKHNLSVHWKGQVGTAVRHETVMIGWEELAADEEFRDHFGHALSRYLKRCWDMSQQEYPLF